MAFPKRLLTEGEELVLDLRPHWIAVAWPVAQTILILVGLVAAIHYTPESWGGWPVDVEGGLAFILFLAYPLREMIAWLTSHFVVTNERLIRREGWFARHSMEMPLERINDVSFHQGILERMIGAGDLMIESAGERGQEVFAHIPHPEAVQKTIYEMSERNAHPAAPAPRPAPPASNPTERLSEARTTEVTRPPNSVEQLERLADLRERGVINEAEFQEEKARILGDEPG